MSNKTENRGKHLFVHGLRRHPLYNVWWNMLSRCYRENHPRYKDYGGRGVMVCDEWRNSFKCFYDWAISNGWHKNLQLDKEIKAKELNVEPFLYSPERCLFVTPKTNSNNRKNTKMIRYNGETLTASQWADMFNVTITSLHAKITKWGIDDGFKRIIGKVGKDKKVICTNTGESFKSVKDAAISKGVSREHLSSVLTGKRNHTGGFIFKYLN